MIISFRECSVPVSGLYLYFASPNWSSLLAITDAPIVSGACAAFIAYASLAFSLRHLVFFQHVWEKSLNVDAIPAEKPICAYLCRSLSYTLSSAPLDGGRRVCAAEADASAPPKRALSAPPERIRECAADLRIR